MRILSYSHQPATRRSQTPPAMAEDKRAFALIGAISAIRDGLRHDIDGLRQMHNRWKDSSPSPINLIAHLTALKSTFGNIQDWLEVASNDVHPHLLTDLDVLIHSSNELARHVNVLITSFKHSDPSAADFAAKLKYAITSKTMERLQTVAQRENDAVNLLLAACHWYVADTTSFRPSDFLTNNSTAQAQRKILLHKSRQIRQEDNVNLKLLAQSAKWNGGCITGLSQLSSFIRWLRLIFCGAPPLDRNISPTDTEYEHIEAIHRSEAIDRALQREATHLYRETKLVLVGNNSSGKDLVMHQLKVLHAEGHHTADQRTAYSCQIYQVIYSLMQSMANLLKDTGVSLPPELNQDFAILLNELDAGKEDISPDAVNAISSIWSSPQFSKLYDHNFEIEFPQYAPYFAQEVARIARQDYVPSEADIIRLNQSMRGIKELRFNWDELDIHLFNIKGYIPDTFRDRWFHQLEGASAIIYIINVSLYDQPNPARPDESLLANEFKTFESWISQPGFSTSSVILILNNYTRFVTKLAHSPLEKFFPDYSPNEEDPEMSARQYIVRHLKSVNHRGLYFYSFWVDLDSSDNRQLYSALRTTLSQIEGRRAHEEAQAAENPPTVSDPPTENCISNVLNVSLSRSQKKKKHEIEQMKTMGFLKGD